MAGTAVVTPPRASASVKCTRISWVADASGDCNAATFNIDGRILRVVTDPGSPAPTANYDIAFNDEDGFDIMAADLANRHTTTTEQKVPTAVTEYGGPVTLVVSAAGSGGAGVVKIYWR